MSTDWVLSEYWLSTKYYEPLVHLIADWVLVTSDDCWAAFGPWEWAMHVSTDWVLVTPDSMIVGQISVPAHRICHTRFRGENL